MILRPLPLLFLLTLSGNAPPQSVQPVRFEQTVEVSAWAPVLEWARRARVTLEEAGDCSYVLAKREQVAGRMLPREQYQVKLRNQPFSVYLKGLSPNSVSGREAIFVAGRNDGNMLVNPGGFKRRLTGTLEMAPTAEMVMKHTRYPITASGPLKLIERLLEMGQREENAGPCELKQYPAAADGRPCTVFEIAHARRGAEREFSRVLVYVDDASELPIMFQAYDWSGNLAEEYEFRGLQVGRGFSSRDFDTSNPRYAFPRR